MKKIFIILSLAGMLASIISCIPDFFFPEPISEDTIRFFVDGEPVELTKGVTSYGGVPVLCRMTNGTTSMILFGSDTVITDETPNEYIVLFINGDSEGSFTDARLRYVNNRHGICADGTVSGTIDELGDAGEYCTGTFSGKISSDLIYVTIYTIELVYPVTQFVTYFGS